MEISDGKNTLHFTVGICYQNKLPDNSPAAPLNHNPIGTITGRLRRSFDGKHKEIDPFSTSLKRAQFKLKISDVETGRLKQKKPRLSAITPLLASSHSSMAFSHDL